MSVTLSPLAPDQRRSGAGRHRLARFLYLLVLLGILAGALHYWWDRDRQSHRFDRVISEAAARHGISPSLVKAVIRQESDFRPWVTGKVGEIGLMQITTPTVQDWERVTGQRCPTRGMLYEPRLNIEIGTWCLARAWTQWANRPQQTELALAQYNAGRVHALRWAKAAGESEVLESISFPSTKRYIRSVMKYRQKYERSVSP